jgi:hypothetical protein
MPAPPPGPEPARVVPQREEGVQHDPVHAVIGAGQQIPVPLAEVISHAPNVPGSPRPVSRTARRATPSGRSPGRSVVSLATSTPIATAPGPRTSRSPTITWRAGEWEHGGGHGHGAVHPGEILLEEEFLKSLGVSQYRLAKQIGGQAGGGRSAAARLRSLYGECPIQAWRTARSPITHRMSVRNFLRARSAESQICTPAPVPRRTAAGIYIGGSGARSEQLVQSVPPFSAWR